MGEKDRLSKKVKKSSPVVKPESENKVFIPEIVNSELDDIVLRIKTNAATIERHKDKAVELRDKIIQDIIYIAKNKKKLIGDRNFIEFIETELQISKGYYYQAKRVYEFLQEIEKPELITYDFKILDDLSRIQQEDLRDDLISNIETLTRDKLKTEIKDYKKCGGHTLPDPETITKEIKSFIDSKFKGLDKTARQQVHAEILTYLGDMK